MQRKIRSRLDLPRPDLEHKVHLKQQEQKYNHDKRAKERNSQAGDLVYARNYARGKTWLPGQVMVKQGPLSYTVKMQDGRVWRRHTDQMILRYKPENQNVIQNSSPHLPDSPILPQVIMSDQRGKRQIVNVSNLKYPVLGDQNEQSNLPKDMVMIK